MADLISLYESSDISFNRLVNDIESLILGMEEIKDEERNRLLSLWGVLEEILAFHLDKGNTALEDGDRNEISKVLACLQEMVKQEVGKSDNQGQPQCR
jgi:predicted metal-dependent peptidase